MSVDFKHLNHHPKNTSEHNSDLDGSTNCHSFVTPPTSPLHTTNEIRVSKDSYRQHLFLPCKSSKETIFQLQLEIKNLRQQLYLSDDTTSSTSIPSNISTTTENEDGVQTKADELSSLKKRNESLKLENKRILQDLMMREKEVNALTRRCSEQDKRMKGLKEVNDMAKEIGQLHDEMECKNVDVVKLKDELMKVRTKATKTLEEAKETERLKCEEINSLQIAMNDLTAEKKTLSDEVTKLKADIVSKDEQLKESRSTIVSMTNLKSEREEQLCSLHSQTQLLASSLERSKINNSNKIALFELEIDQLQIYSKNKAMALEEKVAKVEQLEKVATEKDETIKQQKQCCIDLEKRLEEKGLSINEVKQEKIESEEKLEQMRGLNLELEKKSKSCIEGADEMKAKYLKLQNEMKKKEDNQKEELQNELAKRKDVELNMKTIRSELMELKMRGTNYIEIQKTNLYLEDKIKRQERYLKKKLDQDRKRNRSSVIQTIKESPRRQSLQSSRASFRKTT